MKKPLFILTISLFTLTVKAQDVTGKTDDRPTHTHITYRAHSGKSVTLVQGITTLTDSVVHVPIANYTIKFPSPATTGECVTLVTPRLITPVAFQNGTLAKPITNDTLKAGNYTWTYKNGKWY